MPTGLPNRLSWSQLARLAWLRIRLAGLEARMNWLPASRERTCRTACRFLACSKDYHEIIGTPEPAKVAAMRELFERPFPDGSTLFSRYGERS